jgi:hypothetical protein
MKYLILAVLLLSACSKKQTLIETQQQSKTIFYLIEEVDNAGNTTKTPIKHIDVTITNSSTNDEEHGEDDDDDDDDDCPLPIDITTFTLSLTKSNYVNIKWESYNEENTNHYQIQKSYDTKSWNKIIDINPNGGKYSYIDSIN